MDYGRGNHEPQGRSELQRIQRGEHPAGAVRPEALRQLQMAGLSTEGLRSKSWDEFAAAVSADALRLHGLRQRGAGGLPSCGRDNP